jgi:hypothetical protein
LARSTRVGFDLLLPSTCSTVAMASSERIMRCHRRPDSAAIHATLSYLHAVQSCQKLFSSFNSFRRCRSTTRHLYNCCPYRLSVARFCNSRGSFFRLHSIG